MAKKLELSFDGEVVGEDDIQEVLIQEGPQVPEGVKL